MERNIRRGSGVVHRATGSEGYAPVPDCGGNRSAEGYRTVSAEVTCKNCLKIIAAEVPASVAPAPVENLPSGEHVTSVRGGKTHLADQDSPNPFPLCGSASRNTATRFRTTTAPVDCRECAGILARRAARTETNTTPEETVSVTLETPAKPKPATAPIISKLTERSEVWEVASGKWHAIPDRFAAVCNSTIQTEGAPRLSGDAAWIELDWPVCEVCYAAVRKTNTDEGETMATKTTEKLDVNTDAGKAAVETIAANTERVKALRAEGKDEAAAELVAETDDLIGRLSGKGVAGAKASARMALTEAKKTPLPSTEVATRPADTVAWQDAEGAQDIVNDAAAKIAEGLQLSLKVSDIAREIATAQIAVGVRLSYKGDPDLRLTSQASKGASRAMFDQAVGNLPETFDSADALKKLLRAVEYQRTKARVDYIKSLDENPDEAARFSGVIAAAPEGTSASDAVFAAYKVEKLSKYERDQIEWQKARELEAASNEGDSEGDSDGDEGDEGEDEGEDTSADDTAADALAKAVDKLTRSAKLAEGALKASAKMDDEGKAKLKDALNSLVAAIASEAAKL